MARRLTDAPVDDHWLPTASRPQLAGRVAVPSTGKPSGSSCAFRADLHPHRLTG
jgi:hypothetical protein